MYPEAMKTHGHVMIKKIEFETPYFESWPPMGSATSSSTRAGLTPESLPQKLKSFAAKAWRRPLDPAEASLR